MQYIPVYNSGNVFNTENQKDSVMKFIKIFGLAAAAMMLSGTMSLHPARAASDAPLIKVFKSPSCGCCTKWVDQAKAAGFRIEAINTENMDMIKKQAAVPEHLQSCHTAMIDGYVIEGHVPFSDIRRMLKTRPKARGLSVPGMVTGSPGMEYENEREPYNVILFSANGSEKIFKSYPAR